MDIGTGKEADKSVVIRITLSAAVRESPVMLRATKHLSPTSEILRFAQDDKRRGELT